MFPVGVYDVEDYPLNWIDGTYYLTYKDNTFEVSSIENVKSEADYAAVTVIVLNNQSLTTDFTNTLLSKFVNVRNLRFEGNSISVLDVSNLVNVVALTCQNNSISFLGLSGLVNVTFLRCDVNSISSLDLSDLINLLDLRCYANNISVLDVSQNVNLTYLACQSNQLTTLDVSQNVNLTTLYCHNNQLTAAANSQILIDLDNNGQSNGLFQSSIFGGGSLTTAGQTAKSNLLSKGWTIIGI